MTPHVAIIDWLTAPQGDAASAIETAILGEAARVTRHLCDTDADLDDEITGADAIIIWHNMPLTAQGIAKLTRCRAIIRNGVGYDSVDIAAARERGIAVCNVPDYEALGWNIHVGPKLRRLRELTFGIVGLGRIGTATALRAKALGFQVLFYDPYLPNGADKAVGIERVRSLDELLTRTDVLSLHCPLNEETRHLIAERELALLRPGAFVVNTARGGILKKAAILAALRDGHLAGAGLDVIEDEPLRSEEEAATPNLIATCHAAFCSVESKVEMRSTSARLALAAVTGRPLENVVNGVA